MSKYLIPDKVSSLLFVDNNEDSSTSDRYLDDDDCRDYVPLDDDNEEDIILSDPEYYSEDNNDDDDDNAAGRDANDKNITTVFPNLFCWRTNSKPAKVFADSKRNNEGHFTQSMISLQRYVP